MKNKPQKPLAQTLTITNYIRGGTKFQSNTQNKIILCQNSHSL